MTWPPPPLPPIISTPYKPGDKVEITWFDLADHTNNYPTRKAIGVVTAVRPSTDARGVRQRPVQVKFIGSSRPAAWWNDCQVSSRGEA